MRPDKANSREWDTTQNVFVEGDNLEVLKLLQKHYHAKIKLIYIDPPYNTGNDFVYPDNYQEGLATYLEWTRQVNEEGKKVSTNSESEGRYHSNWLNMMYPRLKLARNLLTEDGVIAISSDDNEAPRLTQICDEIFGAGNFVAKVVTQANKGGRDYLPLAQTHEYVLVYSRNYAKGGIYELPKDGSSLPFADGKGRYETRELRNRNPRFNRDNRPNLFYPFYIDSTSLDSNGYASVSLEPDDTHVIEAFPRNSQGVDGCWRWGRERAKKNIVIGDPIASQVVAKQVHSGGWNIYEKNRKSTQKAKTIWDETEVRTEAGTREVRELFGASVFDHPKPVDLVGKIVSIGTEPEGDDIILDFFAGSGSTAHAVIRANAQDGGMRRFILVQLPEPTADDSVARHQGYKTIADIARRRIVLAGDKIKQDLKSELLLRDQPIDVGFRSYKLAETNFSKWRISSGVESGQLREHLLDLRNSADDSATVNDLLTEILIKQGYSLTEQAEDKDIAGLLFQSVGGGLLLAYLDQHTKPTLAQLRALVDAAPGKIVILEDAFQGDDELKTNMAQLCKSRGIELWTA